jgi:hypothetical protein
MWRISDLVRALKAEVIPPSVQSYRIAAPDVRTVKLDALVCDLIDVTSAANGCCADSFARYLGKKIK